MPRSRSPYPIYNTIRLDVFDGGLSTEPSATLTGKQLIKAKNVQLTLEGHIKPRPGMRKRFAQDFSDQPVKGIGVLYRSDRTSYLVVASGTALFKDRPHIVFEFDSQAEWEQPGAYTNLDTKSSPGELKLHSAPKATFLGTPTFDKMWI